MSLIDTAIDSLGELIITGFEGPTLSDDTAAFFSQAKIGGVLLLTINHNYENLDQLVQLNNQIQECRSKYPIWISIDQEGGRVQRLKAPFTTIPPALSLSKLDSPKKIFEVSETVAKELSSVGINLNYAPVCDIFTNPKNQIIGDRAYGTTEDQVSKMITAVVRGHLTGGVQPCAKHFPGHGDTLQDSHDELATADTDLKTLREREFKPFVKAFKSRCSMVMTAHILNKNIDPHHPATMSKITLQDILRKELRYPRIIISDDLEMSAITHHYKADEAPVLAIMAGCDLLIYRTEKAARIGYEAMRKALESGELSAQRVIESATRSRELKKEFFGESYQPADISNAKKIVGCDEHKKIISLEG